MTRLSVDAVTQILWDTLDALMDEGPDRQRLAAVTQPLFLEGDSGDRFAFLYGLLEVIRTASGWAPRPGELAGLQIYPGASPAAIAYGRLRAAHLNRDRETCLALWMATAGDDLVAAEVLAAALLESGQYLRARATQGGAG